MQIEEIIEKTVKQTITQLMDDGVIRKNSKTAMEKTVDLLKRYEYFRLSDEPETLKRVAQIEVALGQIRSDPFYAIIPMFFFEKRKIWDIADHFGVADKTIVRKRDEMVRKLSCILFSDDVIIDILS